MKTPESTTEVGAAEASVADMTIDQIAQFGAIPVSTVRLYQNKGLLPPPERRGRVGFYGSDHRDRLRLIAHLQERGFSLAAIKESLDSWNAGRSLDHLLGVNDVAPSLAREPLRLSMAELAERFDGVKLTQVDIQRAVEIGLVAVEGADIAVANGAFADIGPAVARLGVPVPEILDEYEALGSSVDGIAHRFREVFESYLWEPFVERGMPVDEVPELTADVAKLTELATSVVVAELRDRFAAFAQEYLERANEDPKANAATMRSRRKT